MNPLRRVIDACFGLIAAATRRGLFKKVEVRGRERIPKRRPVLIVANHFNGFVDPMVLTATLGRLPRFVAKASLRRVLPARPFLALAGVVLVERTQDADGKPVQNEGAFAACHRALLRRDTVVIFPEGTTHDRAHLDPLKTGAARIALGARAAGAAGLVIVPVGLTYPDKITLRADVLVQVGEPIDLDADLAGGLGSDPAASDDVAGNRARVRALTERIDQRLRCVVPDFESVDEWWALDAAAEVALRTGKGPEPLMHEQADLARTLADQPAEVRDRVAGAVAAYLLLLRRAHLSDRAVAGALDPATAVVAAAVRAGLLIVVSPLLALGVAVNAIPVGVVALAGALVRTPVTKGTVRALLALVSFPAAWWIAATGLADGGWARLGFAAALAITGYLALIALEAAMALITTILAVRTRFERRGLLGLLGERRAEVVAVVREAVGPTGLAGSR